MGEPGLTRQGITLLDGGIGSELRRRGVALADAAWSAAVNLDRTDLLTGIHSDYIEAGCDVITANTFAATRFVLDKAGLGDRFESLNRAAIDAARRACRQSRGGPEVTIAASLSCYPPGNDPALYPDARSELGAYRDSVRVFEEAGARLILVEMMQETIHAPLACRAAAESGLPFWLGLSCRRDAGGGQPVGFDIADTRLAETLEALLGFGPAAINVMHSPLDVIGEAMHLIRDRWNGPVGAYPEIPYAEDPGSASSSEYASGNSPDLSARISPAELAHHAESWIDAGATIIGGCCGTTPAHIAALRRLIDSQPTAQSPR